MREWSNIEKQMKSVVNAHETQAPDFIWNAIDEELQKSRPKANTILYAAALILGLFISGILVLKFLQTNSTHTEVKAVPIDSEKVIQERVLDNSRLMQNTVLDNVAEKTLVDDAKMNSSSSSSSSSELPNNFNNSQATILSSVNDNLKTNNSQQVVAQESLANTNSELKTTKDLSVSNYNTSSSQDIALHSTATVKNSSKIVERNLITGLTGIQDLSIPLLQREREALEYTDGIECPSFSNSISIHPFVELNGLMGLHSRSFTPVSSGELDVEAFKAAREASESRWYNWGGQVHLGLNINRGLYVGTGLEWSQAKDKFEYSEEGVTKIVIDLDPEGNPIDTSIVSGQFVSTGEVRYTTLDLPIFAGFTKSMGAWDVGLEGAALINLSFAAHGKLLDEDLSVRRSEDAPDVYKDKIGLGLRASLVLRKYLSDGFSFHIKPSMKTYLSEINTDAYPLDTKLNLFRMELGFRKDF